MKYAHFREVVLRLLMVEQVQPLRKDVCFSETSAAAKDALAWGFSHDLKSKSSRRK